VCGSVSRENAVIREKNRNKRKKRTYMLLLYGSFCVFCSVNQQVKYKAVLVKAMKAYRGIVPLIPNFSTGRRSSLSRFNPWKRTPVGTDCRRPDGPHSQFTSFG
jgi:hypothetical protein